MSRSADVSLLRDMTSYKDFCRGHLHDVSTMSGPFRAAGINSTTAVHHQQQQSSASVILEEAVLLEILIPVYLKLEDREEVCRELGVFVHTGRGGVNGLSRKVCVRLTDPSDPFFLFELEILEDDYGSFKQRLELLVDFSGFPKFLVSMLNNIVSGVLPYVVCFVVDNRDTVRGTLRVLERTDFRTVEHISLLLLRQGDMGQKKYLAERFQHFERAYLQEVEEHRSHSSAAAANIDALKSEVAALQESCDALREELRLEVAKSEKNQLASVSQLRGEHASELSQLRSSFDAELHRLTRKAEEVQAQLLDDVRLKDKGLQDANKRVAAMESSIVTLQSQLRVATDKCHAQEKELEELRSSNHELQNFHSNATRSLSDSELNAVKLQERLRGVVQTLKSRDEELQSIREQYQKQDSYIRILTSQNEQVTEQNKKNELSLTKAHHIISTQLRHIKGAKRREHMMREQIRSQGALIQEKVDAIGRLRDELASSTERAVVLQNKMTELREQLGKTDSAREKLAQELKQSQDALIHLQRSTSVNGRHWSILANTAVAAGTTTSATANGGNINTGFGIGLGSNFGSTSHSIYKEFNKNAITTPQNATWLPSSHGAVDASNISSVQSQNETNGHINNRQEAPLGKKNGAGKTSQDPPHSTSKNIVNGSVTGAENSGDHNTGNMSATSERQMTSGRYARQPFDTKAVNDTLKHANQNFSSKTFFDDGTNRANLTANTASFIEKIPIATTKTVTQSAYF